MLWPQSVTKCILDELSSVTLGTATVDIFLDKCRFKYCQIAAVQICKPSAKKFFFVSL